MSFEKFRGAVENLGVKDFVFFGTGADGESFVLAEGKHDKITKNIVSGTLIDPTVQNILCNAVLELREKCERWPEIEKKGG